VKFLIQAHIANHQGPSAEVPDLKKLKNATFQISAKEINLLWELTSLIPGGA
jgi:hypothetical protein